MRSPYGTFWGGALSNGSIGLLPIANPIFSLVFTAGPLKTRLFRNYRRPSKAVYFPGGRCMRDLLIAGLLDYRA